MKISAKTEYACLALKELALHWPKEAPLPMQTIAKKQRIPMKFLTQILLQLKQQGLVESSRGKEGGYLLSKAPKEIVLIHVLEIFSEMGLYKVTKNSIKKKVGVLTEIWAGADEVLINYFNKITLEDICAKERNLQKISMYTI